MTTPPDSRRVLPFLQSLGCLLGRHLASCLLLVFALATTFGVKAYRDVQSREGRRPHETEQLRLFLVADPNNLDSWYPMSMAYAHVLVVGADSLYDELFFAQGLKYQYPPSALLFFRGIELFDPAPAAPLRKGQPLEAAVIWGWVPLLERLMWWSVAFEIAGTLWLLMSGLKTAAGLSGRAFGLVDVAVVAGSATVGMLYCFPLTKAFTLGQIQPLIGLLATASMLAWWGGRYALSGSLLGLATLIKPQLAIVLLWSLTRRHWQFSLGFLATAGGGTLLAVGLYGLECHLDYLRVLGYIGARGESFLHNQSVNGLLNRLLGNGPTLEWMPRSFAPYHPLVHVGTVLTSLALVALVVWPVRRGGVVGRGDLLQKPDADMQSAVRGKARLISVVDLGQAILGATLASPIAWSHHYNVVPPLAAVTFAALMARRRVPWTAMSLLGLGCILLSKEYELVRKLADTPWNVVLSYVFFGALLVYGVAISVCRDTSPSLLERSSAGNPVLD